MEAMESSDVEQNISRIVNRVCERVIPDPMEVDEPLDLSYQPIVIDEPLDLRIQPVVHSSSTNTQSSSSTIHHPMVYGNQLNLRKKKTRLKLHPNTDGFFEIKNAFKGILRTYYLKNNRDEIKDMCLLLTQNKRGIINIVKDLLKVYGGLKFNILVESTYVKPLTGETEARAFKTTNKTVFAGTSINSLIDIMFMKICKEECKYQGKGSGWTLLSVDGIMLRFSRYRPLGGSSYLPLPKIIKSKHSIINPKNISDNNCFQYAILARYILGPHPERVDNRYDQLRNKFNFSGITFPTPIKHVKKFESNNPHVSVNVYGLNSSDEVYPLRVCDDEKCNHFDLLLFSNSNGLKHYCYIKDLSRLIRSQLTKHETALSICKRCFKYYQGPKRDYKLQEHKKDCSEHTPLKAIMPHGDSDDSPALLKFKNFHFMLQVPIVVYCDFECLLEKLNEKISQYITVNEKHEPMSFCVYVVCRKNSVCHEIELNLPNEPYLYRGPNAPSEFMDYLISLANLIGDLLDKYVDMLPLTTEEQHRFETAENCEMCDLEFTSLHPPVRDHCHLTGKFRAVLCNSCNLKRQNQKFLPIFIHGSSNYDSHFIIQQLGCDEQDVDVIPNTNEKYISFAKKTSGGIKLRFLDSFRFLPASLSELVNNLPKEKFVHTKMFFTEDELPLVTRKGVYPYEYTDSLDKLKDTQLPSKESFYNKLTETNISDEDYDHAKKVWSKFNCKDLGDYSDLYLRTDVLLLSDVFENFRQLCLDNYQLDPAHYLTVPSLTFDAMLKYTKVELELLNCYDKYMFIERGIRGGITSCIKRYAKANNPEMGSSYEIDRETSYLAYIDANNLYGWAMCKPIPKTSFRWLSKKELKAFDVLSVSNDSDVGYIIECDVAYPSYLHDAHNDFPFLPETKCPRGSKFNKLLTTLENKTRYICHYINLKQALEHGLVLQRVRRVLSFNQSCWLKPYIDFNTEKRKNAKNNFEKDFYKLLNNSMFGKSIENVRKWRKIDLVTSPKKLNRLIAKPNFKNRIIYSENLCAIELSKERILFSKPVYIGFTVLELSKYHMYNFYYSVLKPFFKDKIQILYVDTDSFFLEIVTNDLYSDFNHPKLKVHLDMSDYPDTHKCYDPNNKKKLGCFKDECLSIVLIEFIGLRPKLYSFNTTNNEFLENIQKMTLRKAKGVAKPVVKNHITFDDYKQCLFKNVKIRKNMRLFRSKTHNVQTVTINKLALSCNDDKRDICSDGINTLAYGHIKLTS